VERARDCRKGKDYESALFWLEVALLVGRYVHEATEADVSDGACHDGLVTLLGRRRH
jgi:hypothetical protein